MAADRRVEQQQQHFTSLIPEDRAVLWEVNIARNCVESFSKLIDAQAIVMSLLVTVNLIGFLQPPKGWQVISPAQTGGTVPAAAPAPDSDMAAFISTNGCTVEDPCVFMYNSRSLGAFAVLNSLSLYSAISGLLLYVYCSYATIMTFGSIPLPDRFDAVGLMVLRNLRAALRTVALPSLRRRSLLLFSLLLSSIVFCMGAYISAGVAAIRPGYRLDFVMLPSLPGGLIVLVLLIAAISKIRMELDFNTRFASLAKMRAASPAAILTMPELVPLDEELKHALDPIPAFVKYILKKFPSCCCIRGDDDGHRPTNTTTPGNNPASPLYQGPTSTAYSSPAHPAAASFHVQAPHPPPYFHSRFP